MSDPRALKCDRCGCRHGGQTIVTDRPDKEWCPYCERWGEHTPVRLHGRIEWVSILLIGAGLCIGLTALLLDLTGIAERFSLRIGALVATAYWAVWTVFFTTRHSGEEDKLDV